MKLCVVTIVTSLGGGHTDTCTLYRKVSFNWSGNQSLSTGVKLKNRGGRGGGKGDSTALWRVGYKPGDVSVSCNTTVVF